MMQRLFVHRFINLRRSGRLLTAALLLGVAGIQQVQAQGEIDDCGCIDLVLVIDDTGSMGGAIGNIQNALDEIVESAVLVSGDDARIGVVSFSDSIDVDMPLTNDYEAVAAAVNALTASGGNGIPEASDEAMKLTISGSTTPSAGCTVNLLTESPLGGFRSGCVKIAVLVTDAVPGGCDDEFVSGVDDVNAAQIAEAAGNAGILISAIQVGGSGFGDLATIMTKYADASDGVYTLIPSTGEGAANAIRSILEQCGKFTPPEVFYPVSKPAQHPFCITRDARFWATHPYSDDATGATLLRAIQSHDRPFALGFLGLPTEFRNADNVKDEYDALIEMLGLFYRSPGKTGEPTGTQRAKLLGSKLCKERKRTVVELIAAMANNALLGTGSENCSYVDGGILTNFPPDLIEQAGLALAGTDVDALKEMRVLLKKFNNSGTVNDFVGGLVEPAPVAKKFLKQLARDPSTQATCPGLNDGCQTALLLTSFPHRESLDLRKYTDANGGASCAAGGPDAVWRIAPPVAAAGRRFLINTEGSNFDTVVSVNEEQCNPLFEIACNDDIIQTNNLGQISRFPYSQVVFTATGTNTYFIVIDGKDGAYGKLKMRVESF